MISAKDLRVTGLRPPDGSLLVEFADAGLAFDRSTKARICAGLGVREYWVVDARTLVTDVQLEPGAGGYGTVRDVQPSEALAPTLIPGLALKLAELELE